MAGPATKRTSAPHDGPSVQIERESALSQWRWFAVVVFVLSNTLNFLDRQLLAAVAPILQKEFSLSNTQYGELLSAFALTYAIAAPFVGAVIDRIGLKVGAITSVLFWSVAGAATGLTNGFRGLMAARMGLGFGEAGALPAASKAVATYLPPSEWGLASATGAIAVTLGSAAAPLLVAFMEPKYGWRSVFVFSGALGLAWIALWWTTYKRIPGSFESKQVHDWFAGGVLRDRRLWALAFSYAMVMALYMFWLSWTTIYLVRERGLTASDANQYFAWAPPIFATIGGFLSGGLAFRGIRKGGNPFRVRMWIARIFAPFTLSTAVVPWLGSTTWIVITIGLTLLFCMCVITSLNIIPVDLFGRKNAAFTVAILASAYSLMQVFVSPIIGAVVDQFGFAAVCVTLSGFPLLGVYALHLLTKEGTGHPVSV